MCLMGYTGLTWFLTDLVGKEICNKVINSLIPMKNYSICSSEYPDTFVCYTNFWWVDITLCSGYNVYVHTNGNYKLHIIRLNNGVFHLNIQVFWQISI